MFCSKCGAGSHAEAGYCHNCGASLSSVGTQQNGPISAAASSQKHVIWNPNATANWSLIFTPAFGAYLQMLNWKALGEPDKAASSQNWFYASLSILVIYVLMGVFMSDSKAAHGAVRGLGFLYLLIWYFSVGRSQGRYVKEKVGQNYARKPWGKALLIGIAAIIGYFIFAVVVGLILGSASASQYKYKASLAAAPASTLASGATNPYLAADAAAAKSKPYGKFDTIELPAAPTPARVAQYNALQAQQDASPIAFTTMGSDQNLLVFFKDHTARTLQAGEPIPDVVAQFNVRQATLKALRNGAVVPGLPPTNSSAISTV